MAKKQQKSQKKNQNQNNSKSTQKSGIIKGTEGNRSIKLAPEPNDGKIVDNKKRKKVASEPKDNTPIMNLIQFRGYIATINPDHVVSEFIKLVQNKKLTSNRACYNELKRLGYSSELAKRVTLKNEKSKK